MGDFLRRTLTVIPPDLAPGDVTVSPSLSGYTIGIVKAKGQEFAILDSGLQWATAVYRAYTHALRNGARVLTRRHGSPFEILNPYDVWLDDRCVWVPFDEESVHAHAPTAAGVYVLRAETPIFVGETANLRDRLLDHLDRPLTCAGKYRVLEFCVQELASLHARNQRAAQLIAWWVPPCNESKS